jgi:outer membrane lipoprotein-sorting protein
VIVSDGQTIQTYEASSRQLTRTPAAQMSIANAFAFLVGGARIANDFTSRLLFDHTAAYPTGFVIELRPRNAHPSIDHIVLYVDGSTYQVTKTSIVDAQQNTNAITFLPPRVNQHINASVFRWTPPPNAQLVQP